MNNSNKIVKLVISFSVLPIVFNNSCNFFQLLASLNTLKSLIALNAVIAMLLFPSLPFKKFYKITSMELNTTIVQSKALKEFLK